MRFEHSDYKYMMTHDVPTWRKLGEPVEHLHCFEDSITPMKDDLLDAVRVSGGHKVVLKRVGTWMEGAPMPTTCPPNR